MAKGKGYVCASCGYESPKWLGKCPSCGEWDSFKEKSEQKLTKRRLAKPVKLEEINLTSLPRFPLVSQQLTQFFGGGIASASVTLLAGEPGIGKSTFFAAVT